VNANERNDCRRIVITADLNSLELSSDRTCGIKNECPFGLSWFAKRGGVKEQLIDITVVDFGVIKAFIFCINRNSDPSGL
jgi:hypothetical protein